MRAGNFTILSTDGIKSLSDLLGEWVKVKTLIISDIPSNTGLFIGDSNLTVSNYGFAIADTDVDPNFLKLDFSDEQSVTISDELFFRSGTTQDVTFALIVLS